MDTEPTPKPATQICDLFHYTFVYDIRHTSYIKLSLLDEAMSSSRSNVRGQVAHAIRRTPWSVYSKLQKA
jgi:hypothetical protein